MYWEVIRIKVDLKVTSRHKKPDNLRPVVASTRVELQNTTMWVQENEFPQFDPTSCQCICVMILLVISYCQSHCQILLLRYKKIAYLLRGLTVNISVPETDIGFLGTTPDETLIRKSGCRSFIAGNATIILSMCVIQNSVTNRSNCERI